MCGIIGYLGFRPAAKVLLDGLKRLEYRGYDSAGIAVLDGGEIDIRRATGKLEALIDQIGSNPPAGRLGIGHTRWATHGRPSDTNAHPHQAGDITLIHNGIIENYSELKAELLAKGRVFASETDTEVIAHLIDQVWGETGDFEAAVAEALARIKGAYALLIINQKVPQTIIAARKESPLIVGLGEDETFFASDAPAFLAHTNRVIFLDDYETAVLDSSGLKIFNQARELVQKPAKTINWTLAMAEKAGYKHYMLKEIFEQPRAVIDTFRGRILPDEGRVNLEAVCFDDKELASLERVSLIACGTSYHAGLVGKFLIEDLARLPVEVDLASEFRYRDPLLGPETLAVLISQSGETSDTLGAMREAKAKGAKLLAICNVVGSSLTRECDAVFYTQAGPEIGVASTKAFTTQLVALYLLAVNLAAARGRLSAQAESEAVAALVRLPGVMDKALELDQEIEAVARTFSQAQDFLYLGRGIHYPIALEGALKLKEISYIHAEGYPAGEMKHGPIALIDDKMPVVILDPDDASRDKIRGAVAEVKAREGLIIAFGQGDDEEVRQAADAYLNLPASTPHLNPVVFALPLQLLAYHIAVIRGTDVDQPRNLAKSVTVE